MLIVDQNGDRMPADSFRNESCNVRVVVHDQFGWKDFSSWSCCYDLRFTTCGNAKEDLERIDLIGWYKLPVTPSNLISAGSPTGDNSMPLPETGTLGWVLPGLTLQLNGEPGTG